MKNFGNASLQTIFNHVSRHLIKQGAKAMDNKMGWCVCYDPVTNRRCAIGSLLSIKDYNGEDKAGSTVMKSVGLGTSFIYGDKNEEKYNLLMILQQCHDKTKPSRWPGRLRAIAKSHGLIIPEFLSINK